MRDGQCSALICGKTFCKNGFPVNVSCKGISAQQIIPPCVNEKWLDDPRRSGGFMDDSGKPKFIGRPAP